MANKLNVFGKLIHLFTALFPLYLVWNYYLFQKETWLFFIFLALTLSSVIAFYFILMKKPKSPDKEIRAKASGKKSKHILYSLSSILQFTMLLIQFIDDKQLLSGGLVAGTLFLVLIWVTLIFKDGKGILYNLLYLPYHMLEITTPDDKRYIVITKKDSLTGYIKVYQLDKEVFKEWN